MERHVRACYAIKRENLDNDCSCENWMSKDVMERHAKAKAMNRNVDIDDDCESFWDLVNFLDESITWNTDIEDQMKEEFSFVLFLDEIISKYVDSIF